MMAALPHDQQRAGAVGSGYTDLLGIAPGADYRLVVPASQTVGISDIDAAFLAAAQQTPRPNVITASLGFGFDAYGFPSRYLEDDPLTADADLVHHALLRHRRRRIRERRPAPADQRGVRPLRRLSRHEPRTGRWAANRPERRDVVHRAVAGS